VLVQLRDKLVADGEGFNVPEANTRRPIRRGRGGPPESSGRGMRGKRYVEELGRPLGLLAVGRSEGGYTAIKARKGKPGHRVKWEPKRRTGKPCGEVEGDFERESPPDVQGES
jgi:hypothetical protein